MNNVINLSMIKERNWKRRFTQRMIFLTKKNHGNSDKWEPQLFVMAVDGRSTLRIQIHRALQRIDPVWARGSSR